MQICGQNLPRQQRIEVPWTFKQSKEEIALTQEEQDNFLSEMEDSWYKEMFYFMCLTGVRVGELGGMKWSDIDFKSSSRQTFLI